MDEQKSGTAQTAAQKCASDQSLDYSAIESCFNSAQAQDLLEQASATFNEWLPGSTTIPHTFVNTDDISPSYSALKTALCKAGSTSSACAVEAAKTCVV